MQRLGKGCMLHSCPPSPPKLQYLQPQAICSSIASLSMLRRKCSFLEGNVDLASDPWNTLHCHTSPGKAPAQLLCAALLRSCAAFVGREVDDVPV
eukprot:scaffold79829_cov14-Tisochrysis_lutea.AAC.1